MSLKKLLLLTTIALVLFAGAALTQESFVTTRDALAPIDNTSTATSALAVTIAETPSNLAPIPVPPIVPPSDPTPAPAQAQIQPNLTISIGSTTHHVLAPAGSSVLDTMNVLASEGTLAFTSKEFPGMGTFIESIDGKKNANGYYWILYVNEKPSDTGATQTTLGEGDFVEWRYEKGY